MTNLIKSGDTRTIILTAVASGLGIALGTYLSNRFVNQG